MKRLLVGWRGAMCMTVLLLSSSTYAQGYPDALPRDGAKKLMENDRVIFWDVTWGKGTAGAMRQSKFDTISVTLEEGAVKVTKPDGTSTIEFDRFGSVRFDAKGTIAAEAGAGEKTRRAIVVELKPSGPPKKVEVKDGLPNTFPRPMSYKLFDNDRVAVWDDQWELGKPGMLHAHYTDLAWIFLEGGALQSVSASGVPSPKPTVRVKGEVAFSSYIAPHQEQATKGPPRAIIIEFK